MLAKFVTAAVLAATVVSGVGCSQQQVEPIKAADDSTAKAKAAAVATAAKVAEARQIAEDAYIYGYSLITTEVTRMQMSNVRKADETHAPMNSFLNIKRYPPANYRGVSAPNADTLYSLGWLDLGKEPMVFSHPDMGKRFFLFPMYSLWMPVIDVAGKQNDGGAGRKLSHHRSRLEG